MHHAVDPHPTVALGVELLEQVGELALAGAHHRREHQESGALRHRQHLVDDLLRRLAGDPLTADRAVRGARAGVEQPQVVVHLGDRPDRRSRVAVGRLLVDRHRRGETLDEVDVRLVHLPQELAGVGRQRPHVTALALGKDRVERQRRLARSGQPGEDDQRVTRQVEVDAAQVVLTGALDNQAVSHAAPLRNYLATLMCVQQVSRTAHSMLCAPTDKKRADFLQSSNLAAMTASEPSDNYTGHVDPGTAARRTLPGATILKASVGPMDNNAYLVTCSATGETLLIDAANDADVLIGLARRYAPKVSLIVTSHQRFDHWQALEAVAAATGAPTAANEIDAGPLPVKPDRLLAGGDTGPIGELSL